MSKKPGRNDPCSCGSGKKYKRCCLPKDEATAREKARQQTLFADAALDEPDFDEDDDLEALDDVERQSEPVGELDQSSRLFAAGVLSRRACRERPCCRRSPHRNDRPGGSVGRPSVT